MKKRLSPWTIALTVLGFLLFIGLSSIVVIVSREGIEGLFKRKRDAVERVMPEALPIQDKIEEAVRERMPPKQKTENPNGFPASGKSKTKSRS